MGELKKVNSEKSRQVTDLIGKIFIAIEVGTDYSYQDVMRALDAVKDHYTAQGNNLLNNINIQEVAKFGGLLD